MSLLNAYPERSLRPPAGDRKRRAKAELAHAEEELREFAQLPSFAPECTRGLAHLMPEEFWLPAGGLVGSEKKLRVLAERRDAAKMIVRFFVESLEEMEYTPEQIEAVKEEIKKNYQQFLGWVDDGGEEVAYDRLRRVIEDIYGVGAMVERVKGEEPIFGEPLFKKDF